MNNTQVQTCRLCDHQTEHLVIADQTIYLNCKNCRGVMADSPDLPNPDDEKHRYMLHDNSMEHEGYRSFIKPLMKSLFDHLESGMTGLDFGCGPVPVIANILTQSGVSMQRYDPFFFSDRKPLDKTYDFIVACEVIEHFHEPKSEFEMLRSLLKPGGVLIMMTDLLKDLKSFNSWYYKNDPTHVFFYAEQTFKFIQKRFDFDSLSIDNRVVILKV